MGFGAYVMVQGFGPLAVESAGQVSAAALMEAGVRFPLAGAWCFRLAARNARRPVALCLYGGNVVRLALAIVVYLRGYLAYRQCYGRQGVALPAMCCYCATLSAAYCYCEALSVVYVEAVPWYIPAVL